MMQDWEAFLTERRLGVIATTSAAGLPHAVPVELVVDGGAVFVWCRAGSVKARNAARSGVAALVAYKGHSFGLARGKAEVLDAAHPDYARITQAFLDKYERDEPYGNDALIKITPQRTVVRSGG
jgi:nitroimidazol reductase NimA-like FMN-containing flavoprotein (pyridoxamine 5'-phosphate oxidase superfamily)